MLLPFWCAYSPQACLGTQESVQSKAGLQACHSLTTSAPQAQWLHQLGPKHGLCRQHSEWQTCLWCAQRLSRRPC